MQNQYPLWKYLFIALIVLAGAFYSAPNLFGEDPAIQITSTRTDKVGLPVLGDLEALLQRHSIPYKSIVIADGKLLARFNNTDDQIKAKTHIDEELFKDSEKRAFSVALNLAPSTPAWMTAVSAMPMYLGLDLRGGVHFLMEVDMKAAISQAVERYTGDVRSLLREKKVRYVSVERRPYIPGQRGTVEITLGTSEERSAARSVIAKEYNRLELSEDDSGGKAMLIARLSEAEEREVRSFAIKQNIVTLRNRVNGLGVAEPVIQQQGQDRIVVQLPGVQDTAHAKELLGATATLEYRLVDTEHDVQAAVEGRVPAGSQLYRERKGTPVLLKRGVIVTGDQITDASSGVDQQNGQPAVYVTLDSKGARKMGETTKENIGKPMAVVYIENVPETKMVDGQAVKTTKRIEEVINTATIRDSFSKRFQTTGLDSTTEAHTLALLLRAGALAAPIQIVEERTVGPSLGAENISKGFNSTLYGFCAIAIFMTIYYLAFGFVSVLALSINLMLLIAVLSLMQATLTLPGMAGIALTVGMAIDSNVLIFERIREELRNGNTPQASIHAGYERAWATIFDSNITILIAGIALFLLGSGPIRGFAVVLCIGIITSMFSAVLVSRALINLIYGGRKVSKLAIG
ncbi:MAG: protein translocase subunit SecD [Gammaproteobacteria bacterium]|nr:protein translocase subunit SecD [Gammaproteobacteria bacterium]